MGDRPASERRSSPAEASSSPPPLTSSLALLLVGAGRSAQRQIDAALAPKGLTLRHVGALGHLAQEPDLSYSDLARRGGVTPQSMRATVQHLEALGAVRRTLPGHGHPARLEVTVDGQRLLTWARDAVAALDRTLLASVPPDHLDGMRRVLYGLVMDGFSPSGGAGPPGS